MTHQINRPMDTAPRDGTVIRLRMPGPDAGNVVGWWCKASDGWVYRRSAAVEGWCGPYSALAWSPIVDPAVDDLIEAAREMRAWLRETNAIAEPKYMRFAAALSHFEGADQ